MLTEEAESVGDLEHTRIMEKVADSGLQLTGQG
jgi:hypothetical protein